MQGMRLSVVLLLAALAGVLGGGALISVQALGGCLIFDSLCVGVWALGRDYEEKGVPSTHEALVRVLQKARAS